jgi:hypothetical protein
VYWPTVLTSVECAQAIGVSQRRLEQLRRERIGGDPSASPPFVRVGRSIRYLAGSVEAWAAQLELELAAVEPDPVLPLGLEVGALPEVVSDFVALGVVRISDSQWRARRRLGACPPWTQEGTLVSWRVEHLVAWLREHECDETLGDALRRREGVETAHGASP